MNTCSHLPVQEHGCEQREDADDLQACSLKMTVCLLFLIKLFKKVGASFVFIICIPDITFFLFFLTF